MVAYSSVATTSRGVLPICLGDSSTQAGRACDLSGSASATMASLSSADAFSILAVVVVAAFDCATGWDCFGSPVAGVLTDFLRLAADAAAVFAASLLVGFAAGLLFGFAATGGTGAAGVSEAAGGWTIVGIVVSGDSGIRGALN